MTAPDPRVGEIQAVTVEAVEAALKAWGDWPEGVSPQEQVTRILEAAAPHMHAYLLAELRDRDEKLARVESVCADWAELADGDRYYAGKIRAAVAAANGGEG